MSLLPLSFGGTVCSALDKPQRCDHNDALTHVRVCSPDGDEVRSKKKRRVITEARKEQNRVAQKAFRQRQREKRQQMRASKADLSCNSIQPRPGSEGNLAARTSSPGQVHVTATPTALSSARSAVPEGDGDPLGLGAFFNVGSFPAVSCHGENPSDLSIPAPSAYDVVGFGHGPCYSSNDDWNMPSDQISEDSTGSSLDDTQLALEASPALADPLSNAMEFLPTTIFGACLHNAAALGFDAAELATCSAHGNSPFYRPTTPETNPQTLLASIIINLPRPPPPHLRPTLTQVLIPHHPSLDLIPLPHLRDRAIMLSAAMPTVFNLWELKRDIYERGGLVMLKTTRGRDCREKTCQPWDRSSWVAQRWFLRKWTMLVDEELLSLGRAEGRVEAVV